MTFRSIRVRLVSLSLLGFLGGCGAGADGRLDPKLAGEGEPVEAPRVVRAEEPRTKVSAGVSRGDDEDIPESTFTAKGGPLLVTFPGVRMLESGRTRVFVEISGKVEVREDSEGRIVTFHLAGVSVPEKVNRMPLPTVHFDSSVERVRLVSSGDGADLVIELRARVSYTTKLRPSRTGTRLTVDFAKLPPGAVAKVAAQEPPPQSAYVQEPPAADSKKTGKKAEAERKAEEAKAAKEAQKAEAAKKAEEAKAAREAQKAEAAKKAEEAKAAKEAQKADDAKKAEEAKAAKEAQKSEDTKKSDKPKKSDAPDPSMASPL